MFFQNYLNYKIVTYTVNIWFGNQVCQAKES